MRVPGQFYFLNEKISQAQKAQKAHERTKTKKVVLNALKKHLRRKQ